MNRFKKILQTLSLAVLASVTVLMPSALAQDAASLEALVLDWYEKLNNEDASFLNHVIDDETADFPRTGSLLQVYDGPDVEFQQATFDAGLNFDVQVRHLEARVYGTTGVATYYTTGTTTYPGGTFLSGIFRASVTAVWQGGRWRRVHSHLSPLQNTSGD
jgi:ketosteroid isomerase-like protein